METIFENWSKFLDEQNNSEEQETIEKIKDEPEEATDLIKKAASANSNQLQALLQSLLKDPEISATVKALKGAALEENISEGALADKMLQTYIQGDIAVQKFFSTPAGQKVAKYGGPVLAMALLALKIQDPPASSADLKAMVKLANQGSLETGLAADAIATVFDDRTGIN
tara:strand:- start:317 stop:826 length:510 start_codon:yes stop_codon:yes gene_type:complete